MKILIIILLSVSLKAQVEFSESGKPINSCLDSFYSVELLNGINRYHCSLSSIHEDKMLYGIDLSTVKKYELVSKKFILTSDFKNYNENEYRNDKAKQESIETKYIYPYGENLYTFFCNNYVFDFEYIIEIKDLIDEVKNICKVQNKEYLYTISKYLWIKNKNLNANKRALNVTEKDKCPVCGMFIHKYPKWITQISLKNSKISFDGVKDMMKFYLDPSIWNGKYNYIDFLEVNVIDYYSNQVIDAKKAFYVLGSDIYGPMGKELIPFKNKKDAKTFLYDHRGNQILSFNEISLKLINNL